MKWLRSRATSVEIAWILQGTCIEYARNIILFLFEHEREGYKRHADCTVLQLLYSTFHIIAKQDWIF